jgi:hypothetical protein
VFCQNLVESFPHIISENRFLITMADQDPMANREITQRRFIVGLTKSIWNGCEESAIVSLKYICTLFDTVFQTRLTYFAMRLVEIGDLIPCICMHWRAKFSIAYCYWAIKVLIKVMKEYEPAKERLIHNGAFTNAVIKYGTFGARESEKVAMKLMKLFNMLLISDDPTLLNQQEVCKCIDAVFMMLRERPNCLCLHMRAYDNLIWTCHNHAYHENGFRPDVRACLVMRKLNHYFKAEAARLFERADGLLSSKDKRSLKHKLHRATAKPRFQIDFSDLRTANLDMLVAERKDFLAILTLAIWKSKIDEIYAEEQNANRRTTRSHAKATRRLAWWHCHSDLILAKVVTFLPPPV